jgi:hypothetical protein
MHLLTRDTKTPCFKGPRRLRRTAKLELMKNACQQNDTLGFGLSVVIETTTGFGVRTVGVPGTVP